MGMEICVAAGFLIQWHALGGKAGSLFQCALLPEQTAGPSQRGVSALPQRSVGNAECGFSNSLFPVAIINI